MACKYTGCGVAAPREGGDSCFVVAGVVKVVAAIVVVLFLLLRFGGMAFEGGIVPFARTRGRTAGAGPGRFWRWEKDKVTVHAHRDRDGGYRWWKVMVVFGLARITTSASEDIVVVVVLAVAVYDGGWRQWPGEQP